MEEFGRIVTGYGVMKKLIIDWAEQYGIDLYFKTWVVRLRCGEYKLTTCLFLQSELDAWEWLDDWWEGEGPEDIELIGLVELDEIEMKEM